MKYFALATAMLVAACGGKILEERSGQGTVEPAAATSPVDTSASPPSGAFAPAAKGGVEDPCATICERNGVCGAAQTDCLAQCADDLRGSCGGEANAYVQCYAANLEGCAALPPVCESAYCAFARCTERVVPAYCR